MFFATTTTTRVEKTLGRTWFDTFVCAKRAMLRVTHHPRNTTHNNTTPKTFKATHKVKCNERLIQYTIQKKENPAKKLTTKATKATKATTTLKTCGKKRSESLFSEISKASESSSDDQVREKRFAS